MPNHGQKDAPLVRRYYPESRFGGFADLDGAVIFYARVRELASPAHVVVDFGCGRGAWLDDPVAIRKDLRLLKGYVKCVIGIDIDPSAKSNPAIDEFIEMRRAGPWPLEAASVDIVISDAVLEHLAEPDEFFSEAKRVLKPGGFLCIRTSNTLSYVALASRLLPAKKHASVLERVQPIRSEEDVFPKLYRCNTVRKVRRSLSTHGFEGVVYGFDSDPQYLEFSRLAYRLGVLHQRFAPRIFAPAIFAFARAARRD